MKRYKVKNIYIDVVVIVLIIQVIYQTEIGFAAIVMSLLKKGEKICL